MKKIFAMCVMAMCALSVWAVPAKPKKKTITLADGTQKEVVFRGDEHVHFYADVEGNAYSLNGQSNVYVKANSDSLKRVWAEKLKASNSKRVARAAQRRVAWGATTNPVSGDKKGLVILVNFSDKKMTSEHNQAFYSNYFNQEGFNKNGMQGSVHDYFKEASYGKFNLTFDVVGPVTVSNTMAYYGGNDSSGNDKHPAEMVIEACKKADAAGVDFSKYDWDNDGEVDQVYIIYAGYGESQTDVANQIWPHEYELSSAGYYGDGSGAQRFDGVKVDTYAVSCELRGSSGSVVDGIGTACHEFSHCLGIPDFYDTNYKAFGMSYWDMLDAGCYCGAEENGECPVGYTSYERMYCGWLTPTELKEGCVVENMQALTTTPEAYIIYNEANKNEYYLLENRQNKGFDSYLYGHGMLVLHVDFDSNAWKNNEVNTTKSHQRMTIIAADNDYSSNYIDDFEGDPFPGSKKKTALTDSSTPAATLYNANSDGRKYMGKPIENITETSGTISFTFNGGVSVEAPTVLEPSNLLSNWTGFTANWTAVEGATKYEVQLTAKDPSASSPEESILLNETFDGVSVSYLQEITNSLDSHLSTSGWSGEKVYGFGNPGEVKLGSSNNTGSLTSPKISSSEGTVTVVVKCRQFSTDAGVVNVKVGGTKIGSITPQSAETTGLFTANVSGSFNVNVATSTKRTYITQITVYDGTFTAEDLGLKAPRKAATKTTYTTDKTSYTFTGLNKDFLYSYQVRAITAEGTSAWSESMDVNFATGIEGVASETFATEKDARIFDLQGRQLQSLPNSGFYIRNGKKYLK